MRVVDFLKPKPFLHTNLVLIEFVFFMSSLAGATIWSG